MDVKNRDSDQLVQLNVRIPQGLKTAVWLHSLADGLTVEMWVAIAIQQRINHKADERIGRNELDDDQDLAGDETDSMGVQDPDVDADPVRSM